jgi:NAD(P)-dependent dehydrogenase (short-subunit alcohol dehydrogenase family)
MSASTEPPVFLVLGAFGGIGSELCRLLEASGARVAAAGRNVARAEEGLVEARAGRIEIDATDLEEVERAVRQTLEDQGRLDGLANCVGSLLLKPAHLTTLEDWRTTLDTNLGSAFGVVRAAGRHMKDGGSVVLVSSAAARVGLANHEAIAAAKAGILGLVTSAAASYASRGLRFNAVAPGLVRTPLTERITSNRVVADASAALHAMGRLGEPADVARQIAWLLDPEQTWVTGQVFGVDGGLATVRPRASR